MLNCPDDFRASRRRFLIAGACCACPVRVLAAASPKPCIGLFNTLGECEAGGGFDDFLKALAKLGLVADKEILVVRHCANISGEGASLAASQLAAANPKLIYTFGARNARLLQVAAPGIPILAAVEDAIEDGFTEEYARPRGNITGICNKHPNQAGKLFEHYRKLAPDIAQVAFVQEGAAGSNLRPWMNRFLEGAKQVGLVVVTKVAPRQEFASVFQDLQRAGVKGTFLWTETWDNNEPLYRLATRHRIAVVTLNPASAAKGALMGYSIWHRDGSARLADMAHKLLAGRPTRDIAWELPDQPILAINRATAHALGRKIPDLLALQATEIID